jgi:hypothetical protein
MKFTWPNSPSTTTVLPGYEAATATSELEFITSTVGSLTTTVVAGNEITSTRSTPRKRPGSFRFWTRATAAPPRPFSTAKSVRT